MSENLFGRDFQNVVSDLLSFVLMQWWHVTTTLGQFGGTCTLLDHFNSMLLYTSSALHFTGKYWTDCYNY